MDSLYEDPIYEVTISTKIRVRAADIEIAAEKAERLARAALTDGGLDPAKVQAVTATRHK